MTAFDELLRRLAEAEVRFVLIGGLALGALGVVRGTKDVDIGPGPDNLNRVAEVAVAAGGHVQRGVWRLFGNDGLIWPHCDGFNWPHLRPIATRRFARSMARARGRRRSGIKSGAV